MIDTLVCGMNAAIEVGCDAAIMLGNIRFWADKNRSNGKHEHDGKFWTYNSMKAFAEQFPCWSNSQIRRILKKLEDGGYIETGDYNQSPYDHTIWYSVTDKGEALYSVKSTCQNRQIELTKSTNLSDEIDKSVLVLTDDNQMITKPIDAGVEKSVDDVLSYLNGKTGKRFRAKAEANRENVRARLRDGYTVDDCKTVIDNKVADWTGTERERFIQPTTLFRPTKFEGYLNERPHADLSDIAF